MTPETLDLSEAAALLKVDAETARQLAADGVLYGAKIGRSWVFLRDDLIEYLRQQTREQTATRRQEKPAEQPAPGRKFRRPPALP